MIAAAMLWSGTMLQRAAPPRRYPGTASCACGTNQHDVVCGDTMGLIDTSAIRSSLHAVGSAIEYAAATAVRAGADAAARHVGSPPIGALSEVERAASMRVLVLSTDFGGGHDAIANALRAELLTRHPGVAVEVANGLTRGNPAVHKMLRGMYEAQITHLPESYGAAYALATKRPASTMLEWTLSNATHDGLRDFIAMREPDVVVSTFPTITGTLGRMRRDGELTAPAVATLIDSDPHAMWTARGIDQHTVLNPADVARLARFGSDAHPLPVRAIRPPVDPRSFSQYDRTAVRSQFGLPQDRPVILVSGGSWGLGMPDPELRQLTHASDAHIAVATGRNTTSLHHIAATFPADHVTPIGFTSEMPALLSAVDGVVTNSGGLTAYESFARSRPVVIYRPLPGHGRDGAAALHADGLATYATTPQQAASALRRIVSGTDTDVVSRTERARALFDQSDHLSDIVVEQARSAQASQSFRSAVAS